MKKKFKVGLALGSGAARGLAHIGVLKALEDDGISIDVLAGSSMGALVGACYAKDGDIRDFEEVVLNLDWKHLAQLADPNLALFFKGIIHGGKVKELLKTIIGDVKFKDLKIPLAIVAADVNTGEEIVINEGSVIEAVRASISIPALFMPVKFSAQGGIPPRSGGKDRFLIDGGIVNPVPVSVVKDMGATFVIACNVIHKPQGKRPVAPTKRQKPSLSISKTDVFAIDKSALGRKDTALAVLNNKIDKLLLRNKNKIKNLKGIINGFKEKIYRGAKKADPNTPSIFDTIMQAFYVMEYEIAKLKEKDAEIIITPDVKYIAALEFYRGKEAIGEGYKAAKDAIPKGLISQLNK